MVLSTLRDCNLMRLPCVLEALMLALALLSWLVGIVLDLLLVAPSIAAGGAKQAWQVPNLSNIRQGVMEKRAHG